MWTQYSPAKRAFVMTELAERLEKLPLPTQSS